MGNRILRCRVPALVFLLILGAVLLTEDDYGAHWDAPHYIRPITRQADYLSSLFFGAPDVPPISNLDHYFPLDDRHPPLVKTLAAGTTFLFRSSMGALASARVAIALLTALLGTFLFAFLRSRAGSGCAAASVIFWISLPRVFAHAHFVALDQPAALFYFAALVLFYRLFELWNEEETTSPKRMILPAVLTAFVLGLGFLTKHQVHFVLPAVLAWTLLETRREGGAWKTRFLRWLGIPGGIWLGAVVLFFAGWPALWRDTFHRLGDYVAFVSHHAQIPAIYFGHRYPPGTPPWHFPVVMWLITVPAVTLILAGLGSLLPVPKDSRRLRRFLLFGFATPFFFLTLPGVPKFDGVRHLLPSAPFFAALAALGLRAVLVRLHTFLGNRMRGPWPGRVRTAVAGFLILAGALPAVVSHPFQHVFYNSLIGGLRGAVGRGMEADYLAVSTRRLFGDLNSVLRPGDVLFVDGMNPQVFYPPLNFPWRSARPGDLLAVPARVLPLGIGRHLVSAGGRPFLLENERRSRPEDASEGIAGNRSLIAEVRRDGVRLCALSRLDWESGFPTTGIYDRGPVVLLEARSAPGSTKWEGLWRCRGRTLEHWGVTWAWTREDGGIVEGRYETQLVPVSSTVFWLPGDVYRTWYPGEVDPGGAALSVAVWPHDDPEMEHLTEVPVKVAGSILFPVEETSPVSGERGVEGKGNTAESGKP
jgi:hypothetical protein